MTVEIMREYARRSGKANTATLTQTLNALAVIRDGTVADLREANRPVTALAVAEIMNHAMDVTIALAQAVRAFRDRDPERARIAEDLARALRLDEVEVRP